MTHPQIVAGSKPWIDDPLPFVDEVHGHIFLLMSLMLAHEFDARAIKGRLHRRGAARMSSMPLVWVLKPVDPCDPDLDFVCRACALHVQKCLQCSKGSNKIKQVNQVQHTI